MLQLTTLSYPYALNVLYSPVIYIYFPQIVFYLLVVKIVINDNLIEQVKDFKYLGYRISEYKSYLEEKLQTYNKINGVIRRYFGKQMNKKKLRIHNITAKAALKFGSEAWVLKKREEQHLETAQIKFLRHLLGITKLDRDKNQCIR